MAIINCTAYYLHIFFSFIWTITFLELARGPGLDNQSWTLHVILKSSVNIKCKLNQILHVYHDWIRFVSTYIYLVSTCTLGAFLGNLHLLQQCKVCFFVEGRGNVSVLWKRLCRSLVHPFLPPPPHPQEIQDFCRHSCPVHDKETNELALCCLEEQEFGISQAPPNPFKVRIYMYMYDTYGRITCISKFQV